MYMIIRQMVQSLRFLCGFVFQFASENTRILITSSAHKENVLRELECSVVEWTGGRSVLGLVIQFHQLLRLELPWMIISRVLSWPLITFLKADLRTEFWVIGDVFLQNVYRDSAWDLGNGYIGFADLCLKG